MEVNRYIKTRVLSSEEDSRVPDIVTEALDVNFENVDLDEDYIRKLKLSSDVNAIQNLFKYMVIAQCNELHNTLPFMFEQISDYSELLFPDGLLDENLFVGKMINTEYIPEEDWEQVEIIGWLYQYYIAEEKDRVIKAKKKYKKEEIPFATQLFTPKWIVQYMVQNSLGRYWLESHPEDDELKKEWEFYLENPEKEPNFEEKIAPYINKELNVEDIKCFDPACGSGHILVYMFEVLYEIYSRVGYEEREIPRLIIENNLYGLDIDDRAYQLACFAVVMKGASYNKRLLRSIKKDGIKLNIASIQETNNLTDIDIAYIAGERSGKNFDKTKKFVETFYNGKTYGSLIKVDEFDKEFFEGRLDYIKKNVVEDIELQSAKEKGVDELLEKLINQADIMVNTYDILVTNPPYMGSSYMNEILTQFIKINYEEYKSDTFSAFMKYSINKVKNKGHMGFVTPFVWMFISSYEELRKYIIENNCISSLIQLEYNAFPEACVPVGTFTLRKNNIDINGEYIKLSEFKGAENQPIKVLEAINDNECKYRYSSKHSDLRIIEGYPVAYWLNNKARESFNNYSLETYAKPCTGMQTGDNNKYIRNWYEVHIMETNVLENSMKKWIKYNVGGKFVKWYGGYRSVVNWDNNGDLVRNEKSSVIRNESYYFKKGLTWKRIGSSETGLKILPDNFIFDQAGDALFINDTKYENYMLAFFNTKVAKIVFEVLSPTLNLTAGIMNKFPILIDEKNLEYINRLTNSCVEISKKSWDINEISWDFRKDKIIDFKIDNSIEKSLKKYSGFMKSNFDQIKSNEEEINKIFIDIYGLQNELDPIVEDKNITIEIPDEEMCIKQFISYSVGCMLGRYSLDQENLVYAGGEFDSSKYTTFKVDEDNIIPILDESYFEDDIVTRFIEFIKVTFGEEALNENLDYIAETLGKKSGESSKDAIRRYFLGDFYKDHVQIYKKRPIYWLVTSGKQKAFNAVIYIHRYDKNTLSRIRTDYVHPLQNKLDIEKSRAEEDLSLATKAPEKNVFKRKIANLDKQIDELKKFEEVLHDFADKQIEIDLDDGVVVNYDKFKGLLGKI